MKKISFFITFYNQEKYVYNTLSSILNLHLPFEYEILIGDDNSTDNTISKIEEFKKEYNLHNIIRIFQPPKIDYPSDMPAIIKSNKASINRANVLQNSNYSGEYLMFLDGDDDYEQNNSILQSYRVS